MIVEFFSNLLKRVARPRPPPGISPKKEEARFKPVGIVTLCGSTRFKREYLAAEIAFKRRGFLVNSVCCFGHADRFDLLDLKERLDKLHKEKIRISDFVYVISPHSYIGESTRSEIDFALQLKIPVFFSHIYSPSTASFLAMPKRAEKKEDEQKRT